MGECTLQAPHVESCVQASLPSGLRVGVAVSSEAAGVKAAAFGSILVSGDCHSEAKRPWGRVTTGLPRLR